MIPPISLVGIIFLAFLSYCSYNKITLKGGRNMENENLMDYQSIRATARRNLTGKWGISIGVAVVACLLGGMITGSAFLPDVTKSLRESPDLISFGGVLRISVTYGFVGFVSFLIGGTIELGYAQFLLKQYDGKDVAFNDLFSQFYRFGQGFAQHFLRLLYVFLWMLLFIIPGVIKSFSYAMTPYIMAEHPELSASEAIKRSMAMMEGHKLELFVLNLTFLGWTILCALTMNLGHIFLNPYKNAAYTAFYRQISNSYTAQM